VAALESVLRAYASDRWTELPVWRMFRTPAGSIQRRARAVAAAMDGAEVRRSEAVAGGGSLPGYGVPSWAVALPVERPEVLAARLRQGRPPVFCRVEERALLFDLRTVEPADDEELVRGVRYALGRR